MTAPAATQSMFQTNTIAALVPAEASKKRQMRTVLQAFAEQFGVALTSRLQSYCALQKVRTVTADTLRTAAEELLGVGAASVPPGIDEDSLPSTMVYLRFRRSLAGLRLEAFCSRIVGVVGFNFLRYVQDILERVYGAAEEAKTVDLATVIAALERPNVFSAGGMPCIAYRHDNSVLGDESGPVVLTTASAPVAVAAAPAGTTEAPVKKARKSKKAEAAKAVAAAEETKPVEEAQQQQPEKKVRGGGKKRARKEETAEAPQQTTMTTETPAPKKRGRKALQQQQQQPAVAAQ